MSPEDQLISDISAFTRDPLGFIRYAYPWGEAGDLEECHGPHQWQADILKTIGDHLKGPDWATPLLIAIASGHGVGKSAEVGWLVNWGLSTCDDARIIITANTGDQLRTKTIPEVSKWTRMSINSHWWDVGTEVIKRKDAAHEKTWRADFLTWSLERPEAFAGLHNKRKRIIIIFDEASAIPEEIWKVVEGALTDEDTEIIWLAFGNPTLNKGRFKRCFGDLKHRWVTRQIDSRTVPGTNKTQIAGWVEDYGEDSDFVRVRVKGEFPRAGSTQFIGGDIVHAARKRVLDVETYERHPSIISCDVARFGDDQTIIGMRQGPKLTILDRLRGLPTDQVAMRVMARMFEHTPRAVVIDGDGVGGGVVDYVRLHAGEWIQKRKDRFRLEEFHGGNTPGDVFAYFNKRAEVWGNMRDWLKDADIPDDPELETDLCGLEYGFTAKNQIQLERKEDMKKRGLASPDLGDMLAMSFAVTPLPLTRDEVLAEQIQAMKDPMAQHFARLKETERRNKANQPLNYWE
jgi:hypothetical protein